MINLPEWGGFCQWQSHPNELTHRRVFVRPLYIYISLSGWPIRHISLRPISSLSIGVNSSFSFYTAYRQSTKRISSLTKFLLALGPTDCHSILKHYKQMKWDVSVWATYVVRWSIHCFLFVWSIIMSIMLSKIMLIMPNNTCMNITAETNVLI